ncbi:MAG: LamB/YcsF family protein [Chthonomonas sp.]|nr:LamB/YcsF family protein [Chthonomonas sp.]
MPCIDLAADIGEGFAWDSDLLEFITTAHVCCGAHAGSPELAASLSAQCREQGIRISLHIGYPDRESMGRRSASAAEFEEWSKVLEDQFAMTALQPAAIKFHGALYHDSGHRPEFTQALIDWLSTLGRPLIGDPLSLHPQLAAKAGIPFISEGFADRGLDPAGRLLARGNPGALIESADEAAVQALRVAPKVQSLCLHGDVAGCVARAASVRHALESAGYEVTNA